MADVPANLRPWVEVLGADQAAELFLALGGAEICLSRRPRDSMLARLVGADKAAALGLALGHGYVKVPLARRFVAARLVAGGASVAAAARRVRADEATVRRWLGPAESRQGDLFADTRADTRAPARVK